jgi:hypothetical protein
VALQDNIAVFSETARVRGKAHRAGNGVPLPSGATLSTGAGSLAHQCRDYISGTPMRSNHRVALPCQSYGYAAVARLVLEAHRRSEHGNITLQGH